MAVTSPTWTAAEKKSLHSQERDTEANQKRRAEFIEAIRSIPPERLIYLDESGVSTQMTRLYARCAGGQRIHETTPDGRWKILTIPGAISTRGMIATMTIEAATDIRASADDVVEQALAYVFSKDRDFQDFLKTPQARQVSPTLRIRKGPASEPAEPQFKRPISGVESSQSVRVQKA